MMLYEILKNKRIQIEKAKALLSLESIKYLIDNVPTYPVRDFTGSLQSMDDLGMIFQISDFNDIKNLKLKHNKEIYSYELDRSSKLKGILVNTEVKIFGLKDEIICDIRKYTEIPIIRNDFIIDSWQVYQSRLLGADVVILSTSLLTNDELKKLFYISKILGLCSIIEISKKCDLKIVNEICADVLMISRNAFGEALSDKKQREELILSVPKDKILLSYYDEMDYKKIKPNAYVLNKGKFEFDDANQTA